METLPILNSFFLQPSERIDTDQGGTDAESTAAASLCFGGILQQACSANTGRVAVMGSPEDQLIQATGAAQPADASGAPGPPTTQLGAGPTVITLATDDLGIAALPLFAEARPDQPNAPPEALGTSSVPIVDQIKPSIATSQELPVKAQPPLSGEVKAFASEGITTEISRLSASLDGLLPDVAVSSETRPAEDIVMTSFVRRVQENRSQQNDASGSPSVMPNAAEISPGEDLKMRATSAPAGGRDQRTREIRDGEKTVPLRMLLQRESNPLVVDDSPNVSRQQTEAQLKSDVRSTDTKEVEQPSRPAATSVPRQTESTTVAQPKVSPVAGKTASRDQNAGFHDPDLKGEGQAASAKPATVTPDVDKVQPSQTFEIRHEFPMRAGEQGLEKAVLAVKGNSTLARDARGVSAGSNTVFDMTGSLTPEAPSNVVGQVVKEIAMQLRGEVSEIRMRLVPDSLGEVVVKVRMENGNMHAQIDVQQTAVKAVLETSLPQLRQALAERGIEVQRLDVSCDGNPNSHQSGRGEGERKRGYGHPSQDGMEVIEQYQTGRRLGYNTVEVVM